MKTFIYVKTDTSMVCGIAMVCNNSGEYTKPIQDKITELGSEEAGLMHFANEGMLEGCTAKIIDFADVPGINGYDYDKTFFGFKAENELNVLTEYRGWKSDQNGISVDMTGAKEIAHHCRRQVRARELAPLDIQSTIPSQAVAAEAARQAIRNKHDVIQTDIDSTTDPASLKAVIETNNLSL